MILEISRLYIQITRLRFRKRPFNAAKLTGSNKLEAVHPFCIEDLDFKSADLLVLNKDHLTLVIVSYGSP